MVEVSFTGNLQRHIEVASIEVESGSLVEVLDQVFEAYPKLKPYLFDEQNQLRPHIMLALDRQLIQRNLDQFKHQTGFTRLHIMQALSGG